MAPGPHILYQEGKPPQKEVYSGSERRRNNRPEQLSKSEQNLLNAIDKRMSCKNKCVIPEEAQAEVPHLFGAIKSIGDGSISQGIDEGFNVIKQTKDDIEARKETKKKIRDTITTIITVLVLGAIGYGIIAKIKGLW
jgi:hypothetical protein